MSSSDGVAKEEDFSRVGEPRKHLGEGRQQGRERKTRSTLFDIRSAPVTELCSLEVFLRPRFPPQEKRNAKKDEDEY